MSKHTHYLALSLGPIYTTIKQARKTRELWTASYLFSYLMEAIGRELTDRGYEIIAPHGLAQINRDKLFGAGIYPDRLFALAADAERTPVNAAIDAALDRLIADTSHRQAPKGFKSQQDWEQFRKEFWQNYLRIVYTLRSRSEIEAADNILFRLNEHLDTLELSPTYFAEEPAKDLLVDLLSQPYSFRLSRQGLSSDPGAYTGLVDPHRFPSTFDVAALELYQEDAQAFNSIRNRAIAKAPALAGEPDEAAEQALEEFYALLDDGSEGSEREKALKQRAKPYHRYLCIVHVDGDQFSQTIEKLRAPADIKDFSEKLALFATDATKLINRYGGRPIYIGGDDLLFFAPVRSRLRDDSETSVTVFDLIQELDVLFTKTDFRPRPSLSYGLTISYYKYPLFEALEQSAAQLFDRAKATRLSSGAIKNAVAFRVIKHSGSYFEGIMSKTVLAKLNERTPAGEREFPADLLSSFAYKLRTLEQLVASMTATQPALVGDNESNSSSITKLELALEPLFENYFNEPIHRLYRNQVARVRSLLAQLFQDPILSGDKKLDPAKNLYALLRLLNFMN